MMEENNMEENNIVRKRITYRNKDGQEIQEIVVERKDVDEIKRELRRYDEDELYTIIFLNSKIMTNEYRDWKYNVARLYDSAMSNYRSNHEKRALLGYLDNKLQQYNKLYLPENNLSYNMSFEDFKDNEVLRLLGG